jgi:hypothetical protein
MHISRGFPDRPSYHFLLGMSTPSTPSACMHFARSFRGSLRADRGGLSRWYSLRVVPGPLLLLQSVHGKVLQENAISFLCPVPWSHGASLCCYPPQGQGAVMEHVWPIVRGPATVAGQVLPTEVIIIAPSGLRGFPREIAMWGLGNPVLPA